VIVSPEKITNIMSNASHTFKRTNKIRKVVFQVLHDLEFTFGQKDLEIRNLKEELRNTQRELDTQKKMGGLILPW